MYRASVSRRLSRTMKFTAENYPPPSPSAADNFGPTIRLSLAALGLRAVGIPPRVRSIFRHGFENWISLSAISRSAIRSAIHLPLTETAKSAPVHARRSPILVPIFFLLSFSPFLLFFPPLCRRFTVINNESTQIQGAAFCAA
jgi:hypothetical protein